MRRHLHFQAPKQAEIDAVGDESGEQRAVMVATRSRLIPGKRLECLAEAAPFIDILRKIFDPHTRVTGLRRQAHLLQLTWDRQCVGSLQLEPAIADSGEVVVGKTIGRAPRCGVECCAEFSQKNLRVRRQPDGLIGLRGIGLPAAVVMDQAPERDVIATLAEEQGAGA